MFASSAARKPAAPVRATSPTSRRYRSTNIVANLQFEMIGRPDAKVPPHTLWLTGYERSTLGPELARRGARLVQDPHPEQNFFDAFRQLRVCPARRDRAHGIELRAPRGLPHAGGRDWQHRLRAHDRRRFARCSSRSGGWPTRRSVRSGCRGRNPDLTARRSLSSLIIHSGAG